MEQGEITFIIKEIDDDQVKSIYIAFSEDVKWGSGVTKKWMMRNVNETVKDHLHVQFSAKLYSKDFMDALRDELPASYHDNCFTHTLREYLENPDEELNRLNEYRGSELTKEEFSFIVKSAIRMREEGFQA